MSKYIFKDTDTVAERRKARRQTTELAPDEVVLWRGRPKRGLAFTAHDVVLVPISLFWCFTAFGILSTPSARRSTRDNYSLMSSVLFPAIGLYIFIGRFLIDALYRSRLRYILTNQRVIIVNSLPGGAIKTIDRSALRLSLDEHQNGRGTIQLVFGGSWYDFARSPLHACAFRPPHLFRIKDARKVYELLRAAPMPHGSK